VVREGSYDVVLLDLMLQKVNGLAVSEPRCASEAAEGDRAFGFADRFPEDTLVLQKPFDINRSEDVLRTLAAN